MVTQPIAVGIDLGTSNSVVAICDATGAPRIIKDDGKTSIPSFVHFNGNDAEPDVGAPAFEERHADPQNTVHSVKQIIGRSFSDRVVSRTLAQRSWGFKVVKGPAGECRITVPSMAASAHDAAAKGLRPEDVSALVLRELLANARKWHNVQAAVITVPATFTIPQRMATVEAAQLAGLQHLRLMSEPSAAALAYADGVLQAAPHPRHVLVFDLGGGTLDVALLHVPANASLTARQDAGGGRLGGGGGVQENMAIKAVAADLALGGHVFTQQLTQHCLHRLSDMGVDTSQFFSQPELGTKLWDACENAKIQLSKAMTATIGMASILPQPPSEKVVVTREVFERICAPAFERIKQPLRQVLAAENAKLSPKDVDMVLLVGLSTRMPRVRSLLNEFFGNREHLLSFAVNEAKAVAKGAAVMAQRCFSQAPADVSNAADVPSMVTCLDPGIRLDVLAAGLSIVCRGGKCYNMIKPNTQYPVSKSQYFEKQRQNQDIISVSVVEGAPKFVHESSPLVGHFFVVGLRRLPKGVHVTLAINESGILEVTAVAEDDPSKGGNLRVVRNGVTSNGCGIWVPPPDACGGQPPVRQISGELLRRLGACRAKLMQQMPQAGAQHTGQVQAQRSLLATIEELLRGGGGPVCEAYVADIEHVVDQNPIAVPPWSTVVTRTRFGFAELQI